MLLMKSMKWDSLALKQAGYFRYLEICGGRLDFEIYSVSLSYIYIVIQIQTFVP